ncbi:hypothetical protein K4B79_24250 [Streptomyces lincolnensis]|uniref:hypothetical protein n=1 Tax=Streptomyces lincolnensis TaxID=1915 RepID=UPI001E3DCB3C|nr:hypothetical protein [Streptomyces lincolnensis]MCD7441323.1 hypothetical protein [Streptomyces lincolnensis]
MNDRELIEQIRARPGMFGLNGFSYPTAMFLTGFDLGSSNRLLHGFEEWLIARRGEQSSLGWPALVLEDAFPGADIRYWGTLTEEQQQPAVDHLFRLVLDFLDKREAG